MTIIRLLISLALPTLAGYALLSFILRRNRPGPLASLALSFGLGLGILTHWMLLLDIVKVKYSVGTIGSPLVIFSLLVFLSILFTTKKKKDLNTSPVDEQAAAKDASLPETHPAKNLMRVLYVLLGLYILYYLFYIFWRGLNIPINTWDALSSVAFKAKVFFYERSLFHLKDTPAHPSYPILIPLAQAWVALNLGAWSDQLVKIVFPVTTLCLVIIHNYFLTSYTNKRWALLGVTMLISSNLLIEHSTIAYRDLFLAFYAYTSVVLLLVWLDKKDDGFLILASLYAGFATFIKLEGLPYLLIYTALLLVILFIKKAESLKRNVIRFLKFTVPSFSICLFFNLYKNFGGFPVYRRKSYVDFTWDSLSRIPIILKKFWGDLFLSGNWNIVWFILVLSLVINLARIKKSLEVRLLLTVLIMFFGFYFSASLFTTEFIWISSEKSITTLSRLILHFFPLAPLLIVLLNYPEESRLKTSSLKPQKQTRNR
ncbi:hypothetical protein OAA99_01425 [Omnitrophica bacterium]|nr:hypothetical protein [Candidatus Omnitrophota bacterium]